MHLPVCVNSPCDGPAERLVRRRVDEKLHGRELFTLAIAEYGGGNGGAKAQEKPTRERGRQVFVTGENGMEGGVTVVSHAAGKLGFAQFFALHPVE